MQRLFSTFADGWPGGGFFTQRLLLGATLLYSCVGCLSAKPVCGTLVPQSIGALAGILLVAGLWTPVAGVLAAIVEAWIAFSIQNGPRFSGHPRSPRRNPGDDRPCAPGCWTPGSSAESISSRRSFRGCTSKGGIQTQSIKEIFV